MLRMVAPITAGAWLSAVVFAVAQADAQVPPVATSLRLRMLAEEDARSTTPIALLQGLNWGEVELRRVAVRALGRLEAPEAAAAIAPSLADSEPSVRVEAANALAQSVFTSDRADLVAGAARQLGARLAIETHPLVRGALALSLGRLHYSTAEEGRAAGAAVLDVAFPKGAGGDRQAASPAVLINALRGLQHVALARSGPAGAGPGTKDAWLTDEAIDTLERAAAPVLACMAAPLASPEAPIDPATTPCANAALPGAHAASASGSSPDTRVRRQVMQVLSATRRTFPATGLALLWEPDARVRALAVRWALEATRMTAAEREGVAERWQGRFGMAPDAARREIASRTATACRLVQSDPSPEVRYEGIRTVAADARRTIGCDALALAMDDAASIVARHAMAHADPGCAASPSVRARLETASRVPDAADGRAPWHRFASAVKGLARLHPEVAATRALDAMGHPRAAVRAAGLIAAGEVIANAAANASVKAPLRQAAEKAVEDPDPNVAVEAVRVLAKANRGDRAPQVLVSALRRDGDELLLEAARALMPEGVAVRGTRDTVVARAALDTLQRLTAAKRETSRDPRIALVQLTGAFGAAAEAERLAPWLRDFDPLVASTAAAAITSIQAAAGEPPGGAPGGAAPAPTPDPRPLPRQPLPTDADLARMAVVRVALTIRDRGLVTIRLRPDEAPLNAFRFLRLAESGYYTGLTFHRVEPGFVVQGGSPGGNEYAGDGPFSRDEVGLLSNLRGSIGVSTRGRDTGDAQFYINLGDNTRLDHNYTVFAQVESGMEAIDAVVEGDVIEKVDVR